MSVQLTNLKAVGEYGSSVEGIHIPDDETRLDILPNGDDDDEFADENDPPRDGVVNKAFDSDSYDFPEVKVNNGMGLKHVVDIKGLNPKHTIYENDNWTLKKDDGPSSSSHGTSTSNSDSSSSADSEDEEDKGCWSRSTTRAQAAASRFADNNGDTVRHVIYGVMIVAYSGYFAWSLNYEFGTESSVRLLWMTMVGVALIIITLIRNNFGDQILEHVLMPPVNFVRKHFLIFKWCFIGGVIAGVIIFLGVDVGRKRPSNLFSLIGYVVFLLLLFLFSSSPAKVRWRPVCWGLGLQFVFALIVIRTSWGYEAFKWLGERVQEFMLYSDEGAIFIFGDNFEEHFFAFKILPIIIFFSSIISVLYYLGLMQTIIGKIAWVMQRTLGTTAAESVNAAGNIFIGQTEAPLLIRPMINDMTKSELHAIMTGGYATIAGSVMASYISIGVSANHLISASIMAAPCALAVSKLFYPETEVSKTTADAVSKMEKSPQRNIIEAVSAGASGAIGLVANIAVNLMAFISLLAFVNTVLTWMGHRAGLWAPDYPELTFELICSYVLWPFAFFMGVEKDDCRGVAELIGTKTFLNEFVAYGHLSTIISNSNIFREHIANNGTFDRINDDIFLKELNTTLVGGVMQDRSISISTYALCGFANVGSLGTVMGALGNMAPHRKSEIASLAMRAMIAGTVVSFINACVAGLLYEPTIT